MSRITVIASGTRGDVQPAVALGKALSLRGHDVAILAGANFREWIESHGLTAVPSRVDVQAIMNSESGREWVDRGHNPIAQKNLMQKLIDETGWLLAMEAWEACQGADAIVSSFTSDTIATAVAEKLGVPQISMPLQPALFATRDGRSVPNAPVPGRASLLNLWFSKLLIEPFPWQMYGPLTRRLRSELGLPEQSGRENLEQRLRMLTLQAFSPAVVPHPADWPDSVHTTGYWFLDERATWKPPPDLVSFLDGGEPPVYVGFGSMTGRKAERATRIVLEGLARAGRRAILASGWAGVDADLPESVFRVEAVPHGWLFARVAAVAHHGGAGTTAAGLRAGVPSLVLPHFADQPFWGRRVHALGVGPKPLAPHKLTVERLAPAIEAVTTDAEMRRRAETLGRTLRSEDGLGSAVSLIEQRLAS